MRWTLHDLGKSLSLAWAKKLLDRFNVKETPYDPAFERAMHAADDIMARDHDALEELATR